MTIALHELRRGRIPFIIWTAAVSFLLAVSVLVYPEMKGEMDELGDMFSSMGAFTSAFGMDKLNFGTLTGYYAIECGNVLGLGGAFFAAVCAAGILSKEEKERTAEFLYTHPVVRSRFVTEKLISVAIRIVAMNIIVFAVAAGAVAAVGESIPWKEMCLMHVAYLILQVELAGICFGLSSFMTKGSAGAGIGAAALAYALNILSNITDSLKFLKYVTPYGYCDGADIVANGTLDAGKIAIGAALCAVGITAAYLIYTKKDIK